jgi:K(+)-stimulated pyrophosphate-energized sodium pump
MIAEKSEVTKEVQVEMSTEGEEVTAKVTIKTTKDGETTSETKIFTGTEEEVKAQIEAMKDVDVKLVKGEKVIKEVIEEVEENM